MDEYQIVLLKRFLLASLRHYVHRDQLSVREDFFAWMANYTNLVGIEDIMGSIHYAEPNRPPKYTFSMQQKLDIFQVLNEPCTAEIANNSIIHGKLEWLCDAFSLDTFDRDIVKSLAIITTYTPFMELAGVIMNLDFRLCPDEIQQRCLATVMEVSERKLRTRLRISRPLMLLGLVQDRGANDIAVTNLVREILDNEQPDAKNYLEDLIPAAQDIDIEWSDFDFMAEDRDFVVDIIGAGARNKGEGVNVLFYGEPGTGKTVLAHSIAKHLGLRTVFVGEQDNQGGEPSREERLGSFVMLSTIADRTGDVLLIVDEADDIFVGVDDLMRHRRVGSKAYINNLLSNNKVPTIWITNHQDFIGDSCLRRMDFAVRFRQPPVSVRAKMLGKMFDRRGVVLDDNKVKQLASSIVANPSIYESASRITGLLNGKEDVFKRTANSILTVMGDGQKESSSIGVEFFCKLVLADTDLEKLAQRVTASGYKDISMLASGAPGTGKSAYVRHVAQLMGMEVMERRASDILSKYVGESEKAIARAFEEAADSRSFLIFDEIDSLIRSRQGAHRSWEITQVNEMLTQMERHTYPFACTTNDVDALDPAAARRFIFKLRFKTMGPEQIQLAFTHFFQLKAPRQALSLSGLTPGDFAVAIKKQRLLGPVDAGQLTLWLEEEIEAKQGTTRRSVGFLAA